MAKKSVIAGEYIIEIADNGHVDVLRIHRNAMATMEEIAQRKAFPIKKSWNTRALGASLVKEFGDGKTAQFDGITLTRLDDGSIEVQEHFKSTIGVLRQIADKVGCRYEEGWNTQRLGSKLTDYLDEHKDKVDKLLTTPNKKRQGEAREGSPSPAELIVYDLPIFMREVVEEHKPLFVIEFLDSIPEDNAEGIKELIQDNRFGIMLIEVSPDEGSDKVKVLNLYVGAMQDNFAQAKAFAQATRESAADRYEDKTFFYRCTTLIEQYNWPGQQAYDMSSALKWVLGGFYYLEGREKECSLETGVRFLLREKPSHRHYAVSWVSRMTLPSGEELVRPWDIYVDNRNMHKRATIKVKEAKQLIEYVCYVMGQGETTQGQRSKFAVSKRASSFLTFDAPLLITEFSDPIMEDNAEGIKELMQDKSFGVLVVGAKRIGADFNIHLDWGLEVYVGSMRDNIAKAQELVATTRANNLDRYKEKNFYYSYTTKIEQYDWHNREESDLAAVLGYFVRGSFGCGSGYWHFDWEAKCAVKVATSIEGYQLKTVKRTLGGCETYLYLDCTPAETEELIVAIRAGVK